MGIIGCGSMGKHHMKAIADLPRISLAAASDTSKQSLADAVAEYSTKGFTSAEQMMDSGLIDAVLIATPHYFHPRFAMAAFERGLHVLTEKPVAVTAAAAQQMNDAATQRPHLNFAAMFQLRTAGKWRKIKELIDADRIGTLKRVAWVATNWYRTQAYYDSGSWRATWAGEGGGVLLNQCPHNLDLLCWLTGTPDSVIANVALGKHHNIEVEDEVTAILEYPGGATGVFVASTGEAPGSDYLEITGDRGRIITPAPSGDATTIQFTELETSASEFCRTSQTVADHPPMTHETFECKDTGGHGDIIANFADAVLDDKPLIAPASEGLASVELANAMVMSGLEGRKVSLPMDRPAYETMLNRLIEEAGARQGKPSSDEP